MRSLPSLTRLRTPALLILRKRRRSASAHLKGRLSKLRPNLLVIMYIKRVIINLS
jgi:hypothetical protein